MSSTEQEKSNSACQPIKNDAHAKAGRTAGSENKTVTHPNRCGVDKAMLEWKFID